MYKPDYNKAQTLQLSNDAFYWLLCGEEPLDADNLDEVKEVASMFPDGFQIEDNWSEIEGEGMIEATFVPYIKETKSFDLTCKLSKSVGLNLTWLNEEHTRAKIFSYDLRTGKDELYGEVAIQQTPKGLKYFERGELGKGNYSRFYLKDFI